MAPRRWPAHPRSYDSGAQIEEPAHIQALVEHKRAGPRPSRRATAWPTPRRPAPTLLARAAERGHNLGTITAALLRLLDRYGAAALQAAIRERAARRTCRIPTRCAWRWSARARSKAGRRRRRCA